MRAASSAGRSKRVIGKQSPQQAVAAGGPEQAPAVPQQIPVEEPKDTEAAAGTCDSKKCGFLCGAEFGRTQDLVHPERLSIRWAYENAAVDAPICEKGANDYCCGRAWVEHSAETGEGANGDRIKFQKEISRDHDKLKAFLDRRTKVINRAKLKQTRTKRRGIQHLLRYRRSHNRFDI